MALDLPMLVQRVRIYLRAESRCGRVALVRGPVFYCLEGFDHPGVPLQEMESSSGVEICAMARHSTAV